MLFGASFSNHTGIYAGHPIIQVDHDRAQLGKFHSVAVPLHGDVGVTAARSPRATRKDDQATQVAQRWALWRPRRPAAADDRGRGVNSAAIFDSLTRLAPEHAYRRDVGNNAYSFGRYFECKPGSRC